MALGGCLANCPMPGRPIEFPELRSDSLSASGTVLVIGGLNTRIEILNQISNQIPRDRWRVRQLALSGNSSNEGSVVSRELWLSEIARAWEQTRREFPGQSIAFLGYSLGAVLALDYTMQVNRQVSDLFLIAPPVSLRWFNGAILSVASLSPFDLNVPSAADPAYRARNYTPLSHYAALRQIIGAVSRETRAGALSGVHMTVLVASHDEFSPLTAVRDWFGLTAPQARFEVFDKSSGKELGMAHQLIDQHSLSPQDWQRVQQAVETHFGENKQN